MRVLVQIALAAGLLIGHCVMANAGQTVPNHSTGTVETSPDWDVAPKFKRARRLPPLFPMSYIRGDKSGWATVTYTVRVDGTATNVVLEAASDPAFGNHVASAIKVRPHFPATKSGVPVEATVTRTFSLETK